MENQKEKIASLDPASIWMVKQKPFVLNTLRFGKPFTLEEFYDKKLDKNVLDEAGKILENKILENKIENKKERKHGK